MLWRTLVQVIARENKEKEPKGIGRRKRDRKTERQTDRQTERERWRELGKLTDSFFTCECKTYHVKEAQRKKLKMCSNF